MNGHCCTSVLYGPGRPLFQDRTIDLTWVELRVPKRVTGIEPHHQLGKSVPLHRGHLRIS
jgi:hypothetical protein